MRAGEKLESAEKINWGFKHHLARVASDGNTLVLGSSDTVVLYSTHVGYAIGPLVEPLSASLHTHADLIDGLSIDPSGAFLATGGGDNYLKLWEVSTGRLLLRVFLPGDDGVIPAFDPATGELLVAANRQIVRYRIVRPDTVRLVGPQRFLEGVGGITFTGDASAIASVAWQKIPGRKSWIGDVAVWNATDGRLLKRSTTGRHDSDGVLPPSLTVVPGGHALVTGGKPGPNFQLWDWKTDPVPQDVSVPKPQRGINSLLRFAPGGKTLWGIDRSLGSKVSYIRAITWPERADVLDAADMVNALTAKRSALTCLDVGRTWAAVGSADCSVKMISTAGPNGQWQTLGTGADNPVHSVALSPDESFVLAGTRSGRVAAFRLPGGEPIDTPVRHHDRVEAIAFAPDGRLLATAGRDNTIHLWQRDGDTFRSLVTYPAAGPVTQLTFSPDGSRLAFVVEGQRAFNVWDVARFREQLKSLGLDW